MFENSPHISIIDDSIGATITLASERFSNLKGETDGNIRCLLDGKKNTRNTANSFKS